MASSGAYDSVLSAKAATFIISQSKRKQRHIIDLIYSIADYPFQLGDYSSQDTEGRAIQHIDVGLWLISY